MHRRRINHHTEPGRLLEVKAHIDALARFIEQRPAETQAGWLVYLLEQMEAGDQVDEREFVGALVALRGDIEARLATGRWPANGDASNGDDHRRV